MIYKNISISLLNTASFLRCLYHSTLTSNVWEFHLPHSHAHIGVILVILPVQQPYLCGFNFLFSEAKSCWVPFHILTVRNPFVRCLYESFTIKKSVCPLFALIFLTVSYFMVHYAILSWTQDAINYKAVLFYALIWKDIANYTMTQHFSR